MRSDTLRRLLHGAIPEARSCLVLLLLSILFGVPIRVQTQETLEKRSVTFLLKTGGKATAIVKDWKLVPVGLDLWGMFRVLKENNDYFSDEELENIRCAKIDGSDILFDIMGGRPEFGFYKALREILRLEKIAYRDLLSYTCVQLTNDLRPPVQLAGEGMIYDNLYTVSATVVVKKGSTSGCGGFYVYVSNVHVDPVELPSQRFMGRVLADLAIEVNGSELLSTVVNWSPPTFLTYPFSDPGFWWVTELDQEPMLEDLLKNGEITMTVYVKDRAFGESINNAEQVGRIILQPGTVVPPPAPPTLTAISKQNSIVLQFTSGTGVDHFVLYRSSVPDFVLGQRPDSMIVSGSAYEDEAVEPGKRYFYKAIAVSPTGKRSNLSPQAVEGMPLARYYLAAEISSGSVAESEEIEITGDVKDLDLLPVAGSTIHSVIEECEWVLPDVVTDIAGNYRIVFTAPARPGSYTVVLSTGTEINGASLRKGISVIAAPWRGRDVQISTHTSSSLRITRGSTVQSTTGVNNGGISTEYGIILERDLVSQSGTVALHNAETSDLSSQQLRTTTAQFTIPYSVPFGSYVLRATASSSIGADEHMENNRRFTTLYVDTQYTSRVLRTSSFRFYKDDTTTTIDGVSVRLVSHGANTARFQVAGQSTGDLACASDESLPWFNADHSFVLLPLFLQTTDTTVEVRFRAGGLTSQVSISPVLQITKRGYVGTYRITGVTGNPITLSSIEFPFGQNNGAFLSWGPWADYVSGQTHLVDLNMAVGSSEGYYQTHVAWSDPSYRYYASLIMKSAPVHDIDLLGGIHISNTDPGESELMPGDKVAVRGDVVNRGGFTERPYLQLLVANDSTLVHSQHLELHLAPGEQLSYSFSVNTLALPEGSYTVTVLLPLSEDESPAGNSASEGFTLVRPYPLTVQVQPFPGIYEVGDSVIIRASVTDGVGTPKGDATVIAEVLTPDNITQMPRLLFHPASGLFEGRVVSYTGGNYHVTVTATRRRYLPNVAVAMAQTYVTVGLVLPSAFTFIAEPASVNIVTSNAGDIAGFAADLTWTGNSLRFSAVSEGDFLNEGGSVPTSFNSSQGGDGVVIGIARLGNRLRGAMTDGSRSVASVRFLAQSGGSSTLALQNVGLIGSDGSPLAVRTGAPKSFQVKVRNATISLEGNRDTTSVGSVDTTGLMLVNAYKTSAFAGEIHFDPAKIEVLQVFEDDVFSEGNAVQTLFSRSIDNASGTVTLGLSRAVPEDEGISTDVHRFAQIVYKPISVGETQLELASTGLLTPYSGISIPHVTRIQSVTIGGGPAVDSAVIAFAPSPAVVLTDSMVDLGVSVANVEDLFAFAGDVHYQPTRLRFVGIQEDSVLNEKGLASTSFSVSHDSIAGVITIGVTRLGSENGGVNIAGPQSLLTLTFRKLTNDTTVVLLNNAGLLRPDAVTRIPCRVENGTILPTPPLAVRVKVFLQGPYNTAAASMQTLLNGSGILAGRFAGHRIPTNAVDSVSIELRDSASGAASSIRRYVPAWLMSDGSIRDFDDTANTAVKFWGISGGAYYLVVRHRNHLAVMTAGSVPLNAEAILYDFTAGNHTAYGGDAMRGMGGGNSAPFALCGGEGNSDGQITSTDFNVFLPKFTSGATGYEQSDWNLDGQATSSDFNIFLMNFTAGKRTRVP